MKDLKYLVAFIIPALAGLGVFYGGIFSVMTVVFAFVLVPIAEPLLSSSTINITEEEKASKLSNKYFDILLYLNVPIIYGILAFFSYKLYMGMYSSLEIIGLITTLGTLLGSCGINVAHELGHRDTKWERTLAKILLLPSLYMHFFIEHNWGHHKHVGTLEDPASARYNEVLYTFWVRSIVGTYVGAWRIENKRLSKVGVSWLSIKNEMLWFQLVQLIYLLILAFFLGTSSMLILVTIALFSVLLLETINYVEHYGLQRKRLENGRYERVERWHSWNSNHYLGRIILYELTRHSDHHFQANKKYQILAHHPSSPQLPFGYPTSMLMAMVPPLWLYRMNKELKKNEKYND